MQFFSKPHLLEYLRRVQKKESVSNNEEFHSIETDISFVDRDVLSLSQNLFCSLTFPLFGTEKNGVLLFDKKLFSKKAALLNDAGLVWGFSADFGKKRGDTFRSFRDRLDFAVTLYPNHIYFYEEKLPSPTAVYSSKDMDFSAGMAFACRTFYTEGRAVPWFMSVLKVLKISASSFFADFDEWQQCNNCSFITGFIPEKESHASIEKMQLNFLEQKFSEKHKNHLFKAASDLVKLHGAFSRAWGEGEETDLILSYNPSELLSPYASDLASFAENATMEECRIKVFMGEEGADFKEIPL